MARGSLAAASAALISRSYAGQGSEGTEVRAGTAAAPSVTRWQVRLRRQVSAGGGEGSWSAVETDAVWDPRRTAIVIVDMWDDHHCRSAAQRVAEMAPFMNRVIAEARHRGALIIHSPSDCMDFYRDTPQRRRAQAAPFQRAPVPFQWQSFDPSREGPLAAHLENAGCSCDTPEPCGPDRRAWTRQIGTLQVEEPDAVTDDGQEVYNLLADREIGQVVIMGVHTNRCVLGRPFGIRQLVYVGSQVALCRDLTDSYHRDPGRHFAGLRLILEHVERYWCPTLTSESLTGNPPFRFREAV
jgi:nicotinamidase-related amidase